MPNLMFNPASLQSASNLLFRREKKDLAPAISASYRKRMLDDPRYDSVRGLRESAMNHIPDSGWAGTLAQAFNAYVANGEERKLEADYAGQQQASNAAISKYLAQNPDIDEPTRELIQSDPDFGQFASVAALKNKLEPKEATKYSTVEKPDGTYAWDPTRPDAPMTKLADAKPAERKTSKVQMVGSQGPGEYLIDDATGEEVRKVGGIYNKPSDRQPTAAEEKYNYLLGQGVDPQRAKGIAYGGISLSTDANGVVWEVDSATGQRRMAQQGQQPSGGATGSSAGRGASGARGAPPAAQGATPPKVASDRASQNDSIDVAIGKLDGMLGSDDWQANSGLENVVKRTGNAIGGMFGAEASSEMTRRGQDVAQLKQALTDAMANDPRTNEGDFKRIDELLPGNGIFDSDAANRTAMAKARAYLDEIRNRPLAVDPRTGDSRRPAQFQGNPDPLGILK